MADWIRFQSVPAEVLSMPEMQAIRRFLLDAGNHAARVGMEKTCHDYLVNMGLPESVAEWVGRLAETHGTATRVTALPSTSDPSTEEQP
jgi:hypothetical protein